MRPSLAERRPTTTNASLPKRRLDQSPALDLSTFGKTNDIAAGNQKMIQYADIDKFEDVFQSLSDLLVCRTKMIVLAGVIMNLMCPRLFCAAGADLR
jgi:hypothetical protein